MSTLPTPFQAAWTLRSGLVLSVEDSVDWALVGEIFIDREYREAFDESWDRWWVTSDNPTFRIVDLGSNLGYFTLYCVNELLMRGQEAFLIEAVEGSPTIAAECLRRFRAQPGRHLVNRVAVHHGLVGPKEGTGWMREESFHPRSQVGRKGVGVEVPYINLDTTLEPGLIDLLKVDLEGSEENFVVHNRALLDRTRVAVFEFHEVAADVRKTKALLKEYGFKSPVITRKTLTVSTEVFVK